MTNITCHYAGDREQALVAYLYDDREAEDRAAFEAHLPACARCQSDLAGLRGVRAQLTSWEPPRFQSHASSPSRSESSESAIPNPQSSIHRRVPIWAQAAAAVLCVGIGAGLANLRVQYAAGVLTVRAGWRDAGPAARPAAAAASPVAAASTVASAVVAPGVSPADLAAVERRLLQEIRAAESRPVSAPAAARPDADLMKRVQALVEASEKQQQRELALRVADVLRDVDAQRRSDLTTINRNLGLVQNNTGIEVMRQRELLNNLLVRASQSK
jgi:anti-sigma factor RsiW